MSSICWIGYEARSSIAMDVRRRAYLAIFFLLLWGVNLTVVLLGLPLILLSKAGSRRGRRAPNAARAAPA